MVLALSRAAARSAVSAAGAYSRATVLMYSAYHAFAAAVEAPTAAIGEVPGSAAVGRKDATAGPGQAAPAVPGGGGKDSGKGKTKAKSKGKAEAKKKGDGKKHENPKPKLCCYNLAFFGVCTDMKKCQ